MNIIKLNKYKDYYDNKNNIPSNIKNIGIDRTSIYLIENLPDNIEKLYLGYYFNGKLFNLPSSIKIIKIVISIYDFKKLHHTLGSSEHLL